jgi:cell division protein FtsB
LSEKASDLAAENETLKVRNTERKRKIGMLEDEQEKLVKRNTYRLKVRYLRD